jgi:hypothetical protein
VFSCELDSYVLGPEEKGRSGEIVAISSCARELEELETVWFENLSYVC